jgi:hypothetical protein
MVLVYLFFWPEGERLTDFEMPSAAKHDLKQSRSVVRFGLPPAISGHPRRRLNCRSACYPR